MAVQDLRTDGKPGSPTLYLLFAGHHGRPGRGAGALVATFSCPDEARTAFRQTRLRLSDREGWAELTVVAPGRKAKTVSWFGGATGHRDEPPTWLLAVDAREAAPGQWRRTAHFGRRLLGRS